MERLLKEAGRAVILVHLAIDDLLDDVFGFAGDLRAGNFALFLDEGGIDLLAGDADRARGGDVKRMSFTKSRKISFFATKSVSQLISTSTPTLPCKWM